MVYELILSLLIEICILSRLGLLKIMLWTFLDLFLGVCVMHLVYPIYRVCVYIHIHFRENNEVVSQVVVPIYNPTSSSWVFSLLYIFNNTCYCQPALKSKEKLREIKSIWGNQNFIE